MLAAAVLAAIVLLVLLVRKRLASKPKKSIEDEVYYKASHNQYSIVDSDSYDDQSKMKKFE